eukprot:6492556-Amphidinium_carterae.1
MEASEIEHQLSLLSSVLLQLDDQCRLRLEGSVQSSASELLMYAEFCRYDETPMKVSHYQDVGECMPEAFLTSSAHDGTSAHGSHGFSSGLVTKTSMTSKLFSTEHKYVMVLHMFVETASGLQKQPVVLIGSVLSLNQMLGKRATGEVLMKALHASGAPSTAADQFLMKVRMATTDAAPANFAAEKMLKESRDPDWLQAHVFCNVHVAARALTKTMHMSDFHVTGLLSFALALNGGGCTLEFRKSVAAVIIQRPFLVQRGSPPAHVLSEKKFLLSIFGTTGSKLAERLFLLEKVCTGDWSKTNCLEVYVPAGVEVDEKQLHMEYLKAVLWVLCHKGYETYPRHRWLGADIATDEVALSLALHNIGGEAFQLMCGVSSKVAGTFLQDSLAGASTCDPLDIEGALDDADDAEENDLQTAAADVVADMFVNEEGGENIAEASEGRSMDDMAKANAAVRKKVLQWLASVPLPDVIIIRLMMKPLVQLLHDYVSKSGESWDRSCKVAILKSNDDESRPSNKDLMSGVERYVSLVAEKQFFVSLEAVLANTQWRFLPEEALTHEKQSLAFRMSSRMGCMIHELLVVPTFLAPLSIFKILLDPSHVDCLLEQPACLQDGFTEGFMKRFPGKSLHSPECKLCLKVLAKAKCETVQVEWGHGRLHRLIKAASVQTHTPKLSYVNSQILCQKYAMKMRKYTHVQRRLMKQKRGAEQNLSSRVSAGASHGKKHGHGGLYRAFISQTYRGTRGTPDFKEAGRLYRAALDTNTEILQAAAKRGKVATARAQAGMPAFGPDLHTIRRASQRSAARQLNLTHVPVSQYAIVPGGESAADRLQVVSDLE